MRRRNGSCKVKDGVQCVGAGAAKTALLVASSCEEIPIQKDPRNGRPVRQLGPSRTQRSGRWVNTQEIIPCVRPTRLPSSRAVPPSPASAPVALGLALATTARPAAAQEAIPSAVRYERDVVYGEIDGQQLLLDVALPPDRAEPRPAMIVLHAGSMVMGDREWVGDIPQFLAEAGFVAFNVEYRLFSQGSGANTWPAQLDDAQRVVRWVRANAATYGVDPERIGAWGHSAGAQLAAFLGTRETRNDGDPTLTDHSSRVSCVVAVAGGMDLSIPFLKESDNVATAGVLGGTPDAAAYRDFSPVAFVDGTSAPFLLLYGVADSVVPIEHVQRMVDALRAAGIEVIAASFPMPTTSISSSRTCRGR